jgi:hypothetical protein
MLPAPPAARLRDGLTSACRKALAAIVAFNGAGDATTYST